MNIPNDGGWGKAEQNAEEAGVRAKLGHVGRLGQGSGLPQGALFWAILALTGSLGLGVGILAVRENAPPKDPLWIEQLPPEELPGSIGTSTPEGQGTEAAQAPEASPASQPAAAAAALPQTGNYVASKTGTKYYLPSCATAKRIKDENKVWFATKQQAEAAGYQPAANCKGL